MNTLRIALIGLGYRGSYLLKILKSLSDHVELVGIADPNIIEREHQNVFVYNRGLYDYQRLIEEQKPDLVIIASPWQYHVEQALFAVKNGAHIALEIKPGLSLDYRKSEYTPLFEELKKMHKRCYPLENTLFMQEILAIQTMVQRGLFGEIVHLRGGYRHDLRNVLLDDNGCVRATGEGSWRYPYYWKYNADIYPTHGFAPLALISSMRDIEDIASVYSQGSNSCGFSQRLSATEKVPTISDVITTLIKSRSGVLITLTHDTSLPRPRSLDLEVQGSLGIWDGERRRIYLERQSPYEQWEDDASYIKEYAHDYWRTWGEDAMIYDSHHKGMDYIMLRALIADMQGDCPYPCTLQDLALWCSITPLSLHSLSKKTVIEL